MTVRSDCTSQHIRVDLKVYRLTGPVRLIAFRGPIQTNFLPPYAEGVSPTSVNHSKPNR